MDGPVQENAVPDYLGVEHGEIQPKRSSKPRMDKDESGEVVRLS